LYWLPNWIAPVIAVLSFALSIWNALQLRKRDYREQAEQLTAWFAPHDGPCDIPDSPINYGLHVRNASNQAFYDVIAEVVSVQGSFRHTAVGEGFERNLEYGRLIGNLPPGEYSTRIRSPGHGMHKRYWVELAFQDAGGRFWIRRGNGTLERTNAHPLDLYNIPRPVGWLDLAYIPLKP
jgi:hypothetical protein